MYYRRWNMRMVWMVLAVIVLFTPVKSWTVPAYPGPITVTQPDGSSLEIRLFGDEYHHIAKTPDGYTLLRNKADVYEYAKLDNSGDLVLSGVAARNIDERTDVEKQFLPRVRKNLYYSTGQLGILRQLKAISIDEQRKAKAFPTTGNRKSLVILMGFQDLAFTKSQVDFTTLFNGSGSVSEYYAENSWGQLDIDFTVAGPYTAAENLASYGENDAFGNDMRIDDLVTEAVDFADPSVNYADFDNDLDGEVDGIYIIYAGYGEHAGAPSYTIWPHAGSITPLTRDGKTIKKYACSAELEGNRGSAMCTIGVICHEFGHSLGAPDYYDTDYEDSGGDYQGTGNWDLMAGGAYNGGGASPAHHNGFTKWYYYQWFTPIELKHGQSVSLANIEENQVAYYYATPTANEYFFMENRQQTGFDTAIPGHGMLIYHVAQDQVDAHNRNNDINASYPQYMYPVCAGAVTDPNVNPVSYGDSSGSLDTEACPFPGSGNVTTFDDNTTPSSSDIAGNPTGKPVSNVVESGGTITLDYMAIDGEVFAFTANAVSSSEIDLAWEADSDNDAVLLAWSVDGVFGTPGNGHIYSAGDTLAGGGTVLQYGTVARFEHTRLSLGTRYYYKAWSYDGASYSNGITNDASTLCGVATSAYSTDFEGGVIPNCWTQEYGAATTGWAVGTDGGSLNFVIPAHTTYAYVNDDSCDCDMNSVRLITSPFNFKRFKTANLDFDSYNYHFWGGSGQVAVSTDGGASWTAVATLASVNSWQAKSYDLANYVGNANVLISFEYSDAGQWATGWAIDNVSISGTPKLMGDVDDNDEVNLTDLVMVLKTVSGTATAVDVRADVDDDAVDGGADVIGLSEAIYILKELSAE